MSGRYFEGMGVTPAAGRLINAGDDTPATAAVVVVTTTFVRQRFGADNSGVGQTIRINDKPFEIIGVVPQGFFGAEPAAVPDLYVPMRARHLLEKGDVAGSYFLSEHFYWTDIMARLRPGVSIEQAQAVLGPRFRQFVAGTATTDKQREDIPELRLQPGAAGLDSLRMLYAQPIYVLGGVVAGILLVACSNVASLLLARALARRREIAIRLSIGAGRGRVIRQLLTESVLLSAIGGACGVAVAVWSLPVLTSLLSNGQTNFTLHAELNWTVLGFAVLLSIATGVLFGLAPALQSTRVDLVKSLKAVPADEATSAQRRFGVGCGLVVAQIALSLLLLVVASLFARTLSNLYGINVGFNRDNVLLFSLRPASVGIPGPQRNQLFEDIRSRLGQLPGVTSVSLSSRPLPMGGGTSAQMTIVGAPTPGLINGRPPAAALISVGPAFFATMQIPLLAGREFTDQDRAGASKVMIVNRDFGRAFGVANLIGETVAFNKNQLTIVGVVDDALSFRLKGDRAPVAYFPYLQAEQPTGAMTYEVRTAGKPMNMSSGIADVVRRADSRLAVFDMRTQASHINAGISQEITLATLCSAFAIVALAIVGVGLYGTVTFNVSRRSSEIGIRMALGASGSRVIWMILRDVVVMAAAGFAIGLPLVYLGARYVESFLYGVTKYDPASIAGALAVMLMSALAAGLVPALRASRIAPMGAVRRD